MDLYKYETARSWEHYSDAVYLANVHVLLHDDPAFQFEIGRPEGQFAITMLGPDRSEVLAGKKRIFSHQSTESLQVIQPLSRGAWPMHVRLLQG